MRNSFACGEFFQCIDAEPHGRVCQEGLWFNYNQQRCTEPFMTQCELDAIVCLGVEGENAVRAPASCSEFVECIRGVPFPGRCWNNLFFNEETQRCVPPEEVQCDLNVPTEPPRSQCDGERDFWLAGSLEGCDKYYVCYNNEILFSLDCPENQVFDYKTQVCGEEFDCLE